VAIGAAVPGVDGIEAPEEEEEQTGYPGTAADHAVTQSCSSGWPSVPAKSGALMLAPLTETQR
jgi:hypothetical protein